MSFKAKFKAGGKELNILDCHYAFSQNVDATGRPSSITRGGQITLTVESTADTTLFEWMTNNYERKEGSIVFFKRDTDATLKEIKFKEAYVIAYAENFNSDNEKPLFESFTLSAKSIQVGNGEHKNEWV